MLRSEICWRVPLPMIVSNFEDRVGSTWPSILRTTLRRLALNSNLLASLELTGCARGPFGRAATSLRDCLLAAG